MSMSTIEEALLNIADACDGARSSDSKGFNKLDAPKGNELAAKLRDGKKLTADERGIAYTLLRTYKKQLARNGIDYGSIEKPTKESDPPEKDEYQQEIEAELANLEKYKPVALKILECGDPLKYFLNTYNKIHIGDRDAGEIQLIAFGCQAANNTDGVHVNWVGPSGKGKSDGARACHHLLPKIYVLKGSVTAKSLYHHTDLPDGVSVLLDDTDVKEGGDLEATVKRAIRKGLIMKLWMETAICKG
jgi:hypothetical protein